MNSIALGIKVGRQNGKVNTSEWEKFLQKACDVHANRLLDDSWNPRNTAEAFYISPFLISSELFQNKEYQTLALKLADYYAAYRRLMQQLDELDVTKDEEFQRRFIAFHRISHRSPAWHTTYFQLLEVAKVIGAEFSDVLDELWEETGRYEPAYRAHGN